MHWLSEFIRDGSAASGMAILALAVALGLALGSIRIRGARLGISGVLFSALVFGQFGLTVNEAVLSFLRDFGLVIFAYAIGLQMGPGFASSFRAEGLRLNLLAVAAVALGAAMTLVIVWICHLPGSNSPGLYSGAFTTTPGLAAGQDAIRHAFAGDRVISEKAGREMDTAGRAFAVTYPFGVVGPILVIVALRWLFGANVPEELAKLMVEEAAQRTPIATIDFELTNPAHAGILLREHALLQGGGVIFSRLMRDGAMMVPTGETETRVGDVYRAVGPRAALEALVQEAGQPVTIDLGAVTGDVKREEMVVTRTHVLRRTLRDLNFRARDGVTIAHVTRFGVELTPGASFKLLFGDRVTAIGPAEGLKMVEVELGNSQERLDRAQLVPIFLGIVLGVMFGSIPLKVPGLSTSMCLGLAGGPMIAAIVLSQLGNIGAVVWYMPASANQLFRDFGLAVFLACVGLSSGKDFYQHIVSGNGLVLVAWGAIITILPVLLVGCWARVRYKMNFVTLAGWVAGAMTSSPALVFANDLTDSEAPSVAFAAVAPLAMLTPVICSQLLVIGMR